MHRRVEFTGLLTCYESLERPGGRLPALCGRRGSCSVDRIYQAPRRLVADAAVRANLIVISPPSLALRPRVVEIHEPVRVQALRPYAPVEGLGERIVGRLAVPQAIQRDILPVRPQIQVERDELAALINPNRLREPQRGARLL